MVWTLFLVKKILIRGSVLFSIYSKMFQNQNWYPSLVSTGLVGTVAPPRVELELVSLPGIELELVSLPRIELELVSLPRVELERVSLPRVELERVSLPRIELELLSLPCLELDPFPALLGVCISASKIPPRIILGQGCRIGGSRA